MLIATEVNLIRALNSSRKRIAPAASYPAKEPQIQFRAFHVPIAKGLRDCGGRAEQSMNSINGI
jgi:hypothetical protein